MTLYIPTTQEVRNRYVFGTYWENDGDTSGGDNAPFNRWLAQHDAEVAKAVEEHIIKLLEKQFTYKESALRDHLIALIKGEK